MIPAQHLLSNFYFLPSQNNIHPLILIITLIPYLHYLNSKLTYIVLSIVLEIPHSRFKGVKNI